MAHLINMDTATKGAAKRLTISLLSITLLAGCAIVPYDPGYPAYSPYSSYPYGSYVTPGYVGPPIYTGPTVEFGFGFRGDGRRGYWDGHHVDRHWGHSYRDR